MAGTERYIGTPNGIMLCIDRNGGGLIEGFLYHGYRKEGIPIRGYEQVIRTAEELFNALGFPFMGTGNRDIHGRIHSCQKKERMARVLRDDELLEKHGNMGTFVIRVQHRQHSSWQGRVTYLEENKSVYFRSALELIKIIDGALDEVEQAAAAEIDGNEEVQYGE